MKFDTLHCKNINITTDLTSKGNDQNLKFLYTSHKISEKLLTTGKMTGVNFHLLYTGQLLGVNVGGDIARGPCNSS